MSDLQDLYRIYRQYPSVETDTRKLRPGDLFFAIRGEHFNGNDFAAKALELGAARAVVDEPVAGADPGRIIRVEDTLRALQDLAKVHREQFQIPFIAITGSNGKTTTKELIHAVLSTRFKTYTTEGNLNNHLGIPLTLLRIREDAEIAVIEMGANHLGEISGYCRYAIPTHGLITNSGKAHLEGFGSVENVRKGKGELFDFLRVHAGTAFVMWDYAYLREMSQGIPHRVTYGGTGADISGSIRSATPFLSIDFLSASQTVEINTQLVGDYNFPNVLAAVAVGLHFGVPAKSVREAIASYTPSNSRSQLIDRGSNHFILDAYNANPSSMQAAIANFAKLPAQSKVLILGAMAELGPDSLEEHQRIIDEIGNQHWADVALVGGDFLHVDHPYRRFSNAQEAGDWLKQATFANTYFLIKGSRNMQMEKVLEG